MEIPSNILRHGNVARVTDDITGSAVSLSLKTNNTHDNYDYLPPKRPKKLLVECTERDSNNSLIPFASDEASVVKVRILSVSKNENSGAQELQCICEQTGTICRVSLQGIWAATPVKIGSSLNLIGVKVRRDKELLLDWENGVLILESNVLVPCTLIAQSTYCRRKAVLSHYFKETSGSNKEMIIGNVAHELFQTAVTRLGFDVTERGLMELWREKLREQYAAQIFALDLSPDEMENELCRYFKAIINWTTSHMPPPKGRNEELQMGSKVTEVIDVEESLWNSCYGLKAKIDCTLKVETKNGEQKLLPVELKTGKSVLSTEHTTQVMLYCLALAAKQGTVESGLLLYLLDETSRTVSPKTVDLKGILHIRNEIAANISAISFDFLPEPLENTRGCGRCSQALSCSLLYHTKFGSHQIDEFFKLQLKHLEQVHVDYFNKFVRWILMEWSCFVNRDLSDKENIDDNRKKSSHYLRVIFHCAHFEEKKTIVTFKPEELTDEQLELFTKGDLLLVRSLDYAVITTASVISVETGKYLNVALNSKSSSFVGQSTYLLEKCESSSSFTTNLGNLIVLMSDRKEASRIRSLIIDMKPPTFSKLKKEDLRNIAPMVRQLNSAQARAVIVSLMANDYAVVKGFPGSGKTSTLVVLIRCLLSYGRTVLITSHTHSAIDNLLSKLVQCVDMDQILRLGQQSSVKEDLQHLTLDAKLCGYAGAERISRMEIILKETPIVACTCLAISNNPLFSYRRFSITLVDEASLVLEPTIIPAIAVSDSFVLVGDYKQLTPFVRSQQAREEGMAKSLLERLTVHKEAVITLCLQYRMNRPIAELSSVLFYENELRCANNVVAESCLTGLTYDSANSDLSEVYRLCVSNSLNTAVIFVDTQSHKNPLFCANFGKSGAEITNSGEANFVESLCKLFIKLGLPEKDLGVISVYRYHAERLRRMVQSGIEVNTVDQYQGKDKSVIIVSFVWTGGENRKSDLLADSRRVNVALTRSKHKLIMVGCRKSLSSCPPVNAVINAIPEMCITTLHK